MGSDSDFSDVDASSYHDDSDTIVISSKSRILISPRKKGSKAVSKLLVGAAADDVVEKLLRRSGSGVNVVTRRDKSATVSVGSRSSGGRGRNATSTSTTHTVSATRTRGAREPQAQRRNRVDPVRRDGRSGSGSGELGDESDVSDVSSELSAPSSDSMSERNERRVHTNAAERNEGARKMDVNDHRRTAERDDRQTEKSENRRDGESENECDEELPSDGHDSDESSETKGSSHSQLEIPRRPRSSAQRKFDDQLRVSQDDRSDATSTSRLCSTETKRHTSSASLVRVDRSSSDIKKSISRRSAASDLDDSVILPTSATREMEDLKKTLKNLAHHDPTASKTSNKSHRGHHTGPSRKTKTVSGGGDNSRREQHLNGNVHTESAFAAALHTSTHDDSFLMTTPSFKKKLRRPSFASDESDASDLDLREPSIARNLFSTPPPPTRPSCTSSTPPTAPLSGATKRTTPPQLSTSFQSTSGYASALDTSLVAASASTAQGSRAVLSALKALQDKIRRLEDEREKLMQELSDVKVKARKREAEFASSEKKFAYELGQTKESARAAYDAIRSEKEELKLALVKYEERRKAMEAELHHAHKLSSTYSGKAEDLQSQLQMSESQRKSLQAEMDAMRDAHKQEVRDLNGQLATLQKENQAAQDQIRILETQIDRESQHLAETRERLRESEQTVAGISQLNEKLVAKVWEANEIANKATKKSKKLQQSQRVSTLSRPTAASRAASITAANGSSTPGKPASSVAKKTRTGSASLKSGGNASIRKEKRPSQLSAQSVGFETLSAPHLMSRDVPFVLGTSANRSHSIVSNVQEAIRQCDTTYAAPITNPPPTPTTLLRPRKSKGVVRKVTSTSNALDERGAGRSTSTSASILGINSAESSSATLVGSRARPRTSANEASQVPTPASAPSARPSAIRVPTPTTSYANPMQSQIMEDLEAAVQSAEKEFTTLNRRYQDAVARVEAGMEGSAQLSASLGTMLDELEAKGKQINLLKQVYEQASRSSINPIRRVVHSPEAIRRKTASLRILNDYRQLEREAKSPRSATPAHSPTNTSRHASFFSDTE